MALCGVPCALVVAAGARCMLVLPHSSKLWVGSDDGRVWVVDGVAETLLGSFRPHPGSEWAVTALAVVGRGVWSACERCLAVHDPETGVHTGSSSATGWPCAAHGCQSAGWAFKGSGCFSSGRIQKAAAVCDYFVCVTLLVAQVLCATPCRCWRVLLASSSRCCPGSGGCG
jgi:hypothetical protein